MKVSHNVGHRNFIKHKYRILVLSYSTDLKKLEVFMRLQLSLYTNILNCSTKPVFFFDRIYYILCSWNGDLCSWRNKRYTNLCSWRKKRYTNFMYEKKKISPILFGKKKKVKCSCKVCNATKRRMQENKPNLLQFSLVANKLNPPILHGAPKNFFRHLCSWI